ncbi:MAG: tyrosine/serine/threonine protein phosphatase pps1 [Thelocarpon impressellum]|nr:MAG: tyrosine/serine/threonine protein phosphatase pps1 [Thelocarpon impressellum]
MATVVARPAHVRPSHTPPPLAPILSFNATKSAHEPVPNKHLQPLSPGYPPTLTPDTPPASPPTKFLSIKTSSILHPPDPATLLFEDPAIYSIDAQSLAAALDHISSQPLPEPRQVFPWLHGLHRENKAQVNFFVPKRRSLRRTPKCIRGITLVKADGDLNVSKLKGAVAPEELLCLGQDPDSFLDPDPKDGFSVRNFQIQACKMGLVSDVVVYDDAAEREDVYALAKKISRAQALWRSRNDPDDRGLAQFHTFVVTSPFDEFERTFPDLVAVDAKGRTTGQVMDFFQWERIEMCSMSRATEIATNVWLGPTPDSPIARGHALTPETPDFDLLIEASDLAQMPDAASLKRTVEALREADGPLSMEFPSSGSIMPPGWSQSEIGGITDVCRWIHGLANPEASDLGSEERDGDGDLKVVDAPPSIKVLIHCADGYTESSLLALAYFVHAEGIPVHEAWLRLHCEKGRNFFAYPSDVALLKSLEPSLLQGSRRSEDVAEVSDPPWLSQMDGSLPSRILPYMYLGNLGHANNPELLKALGIKRVLSVGEPLSWSKADQQKWGRRKLCYIDNVQDNGIDPLTNEFSRCLDFIEAGQQEGTATLVHCRVGVSRSATICIAEVMKSAGLSFPRAYCFVRARRLNVIIQPHLRFSYELLKWEELQQAQRGQALKRELEWATIAREIALMNRPYAR